MRKDYGRRSSGMAHSEVEIISVSRDTRTVVIRKCPRSMQQVLDALCEHWKENEMPWSITEVLRYAPPQKLFYSVEWIEDD